MENCCEGDGGGVAKQPPEHRPKRLAKTADELATVTQSPQRRDARAAPNPKSWAAAEVVCHLRDVEEGSRRRRRATRLLKGGNDIGTIQAGERVDMIAVGDDDSLRSDNQIRKDPPRQSRQTRARRRPVGKLDF